MRNRINNNTTLTLHPYIRTGDVYREHQNSCNFTIKDVIGQGGSSIVYLAEDMFGNEVLLKEYFPNDLFVERCDDNISLKVPKEFKAEFDTRRKKFCKGLEIQNKLHETYKRIKENKLHETYKRIKGGHKLENKQESGGEEITGIHFWTNDRDVNKFVRVLGIYTGGQISENQVPGLFAVMDSRNGFGFENMFDKNSQYWENKNWKYGKIGSLLQALRAVASSLECIHAIGYYYIDVKPENFYVEELDDETFTVTLFDFDSAVPIQPCEHPDEPYSYSVGWAAPELKRHHISEESVVFSIGALMFAMLFGRQPELEDMDDRLGKWKPDEIDDGVFKDKAMKNRMYPRLNRFLSKTICYVPKWRWNLATVCGELKMLCFMANKEAVYIAETAESFIRLCRNNEMNAPYQNKFIFLAENSKSHRRDYSFYHPTYDAQAMINVMSEKTKEANKHLSEIRANRDSSKFKLTPEQMINAYKLTFNDYPIQDEKLNYRTETLVPTMRILRALFPLIYAELITEASKLYLKRGRYNALNNDPWDALRLLREARTIYDRELFKLDKLGVSSERFMIAAKCDTLIVEAMMMIKHNHMENLNPKKEAEDGYWLDSLWFDNADEIDRDIDAYAQEAIEYFPYTDEGIRMRNELAEKCAEFYKGQEELVKKYNNYIVEL